MGLGDLAQDVDHELAGCAGREALGPGQGDALPLSGLGTERPLQLVAGAAGGRIRGITRGFTKTRPSMVFLCALSLELRSSESFDRIRAPAASLKNPRRW